MIEVVAEVAVAIEAAAEVVVAAIEAVAVVAEAVEVVLVEEAAEVAVAVLALVLRLLWNHTIVSLAFTSCAAKTMPFSLKTLFLASQFTMKSE